MSNSTFATRFYSYNNSYALKIQTIKLQVAAAWLRSKGCIFSTYSDRSTGLTKIYLKSIPTNVVEALVKKHGFFNAKATAAKAAPVPATTSTVGTLSREEWLSRFRSNDPKAVAQPKARAIKNADESVVLKAIATVVPQLAVESNLYNKEMQNGVPVVTGFYTCRTVQIEGDGFFKALPLTSRPQTNSDLAGGVKNADAQQSIVDAIKTPITNLNNAQLRAQCISRGIKLGSGWTRNHVLVAHLRSLGVTEV